ncbi:MAG: hypothetical protein ACW99A_08700 [Candidatus Kariarchaeaceae archaeon]|jgi:hypothetical protein
MPEETKSKIKKVIEVLGDEALKNKNLTYEELQILKQVSYDLKEYESALEKALEDGVITENENQRLNYLKDQINKNALTVANADRVIDEEEQGLISKLCEVLDNYL